MARSSRGLNTSAIQLPLDAHPEFFTHHQAAWLPIGCFVIRSRDRLVLVDAGLGPELQELPHGMYLVGGQLITGLRALGIGAGDWQHFVDGHGHMADHVREGLRAGSRHSRIEQVDKDATVAPGVMLLLTPGHTPGHICVVVASGRARTADG
ncbi:hypothetical protein [Phytoactinopolyspora limicola]|uniref:hypothetical protein n=1 Tax=Phytoactinopolyspora limicola TaxID=2715536 RepID=UPI00140E10F4|nr:hypothetical protein [Phytoactinopolyspora limicola]